MSSPKTNTRMLSFADRLQLVSVEVSKRVSQAKPTAKAQLRARLWCQWLRKEALS